MTIPDWAWPAIGAILAALGFYFGRRKDRDQQIEERAALNTKVDVLITNVATLDKNMTTALGGVEARHAMVCGKVDEHAERIAKVEESAKQAHKRLDEHIKGGN